MFIIVHHVASDLSKRTSLTSSPWKLSGANLAKLLLSMVDQLDLNMENYQGLGFNEAANMVKFIVCAAVTQHDYPFSKAAKASTIVLVLSSPRRVSFLKSMWFLTSFLRCMTTSTRQTRDAWASQRTSKRAASSDKILNFCKTHWLEQHDSFIFFKELLPAATKFLDETDSKAIQLLTSIHSSKFIIGLISRESMIVHTVQPSILPVNCLQHSFCLLHNEQHHFDIFSMVRENTDIKFHKLFSKPEELAAEIGAEAISIPQQAVPML